MVVSRRGISPVIATVIIVAVAIAIAIAVAGWLMGLWGTFGTTESLRVMPNSTLVVSTTTNGTTATLTLAVKNTGSKPATITEVQIVGVDSYTTFTLNSGNTTTTAAKVTVDPGKTVVITIGGITGISPGAQYAVRVYTEGGNVYTGYVMATTS